MIAVSADMETVWRIVQDVRAMEQCMRAAIEAHRSGDEQRCEDYLGRSARICGMSKAEMRDEMMRRVEMG